MRLNLEILLRSHSFPKVKKPIILLLFTIPDTTRPAPKISPVAVPITPEARSFFRIDPTNPTRIAPYLEKIEYSTDKRHIVAQSSDWRSYKNLSGSFFVNKRFEGSCQYAHTHEVHHSCERSL